jgi:transposase-like protein
MAARDFVMWFMRPATRAAAEAESRQWMATCEHCHNTHSIWDLGGLRYHAAGRPVMRRKCPDCGQWSSFQVFWGGTAPAPAMHDTQLHFLSETARADAEAESKLWMAECPNCHAKTSIWDLGGIRYKAAGDGSWAVYRCTHCGKSGWHHIRWEGPAKG